MSELLLILAFVIVIMFVVGGFVEVGRILAMEKDNNVVEDDWRRDDEC